MSQAQKNCIMRKVAEGLARGKLLTDALDLMMEIAKVPLSDARQELAIEVLASLPKPATMPAFIAAVKANPAWHGELDEFCAALAWASKTHPHGLLFDESERTAVH